jgi:ribonuclease HIII
MTYSIKINENNIKILKKLLYKNNFDELSPGPYQFFRYKKGKCSVILYTSLKLVLQGECETLRNELNEILGDDFFPHYGSDETGKGDFFGPLVICATYVDEKAYKILLEYGIIGSESKNTSVEKIKKFTEIITNVCEYEKVVINPEKYNELYEKIGNLNKLMEWAHSTAIKSLYKKVLATKPVIIDKFSKNSALVYKLKTLGSEIILEEKAEKYPAVACASILARNFQISWFLKKEKEFNIKIPRGASAVKNAANEILKKYGIETLKKLCKTHFKTFSQISGF